MTTTSKQTLMTLLGASIGAIIIVAAAKFLRGSPAKEWVPAALYGSGFFLFYLPITMRSKSRCC